MYKFKFEYRITAAYILIGGLWIIFSDKILNYFIRDADTLTRIQTYKGWFYVLLTSVLFYSFLKRHLVKIRDAEQKAKESDSLKTAFLQNISHEIRTPMNSIVGFSELLKDDKLSQTEKVEYLEMITRSSDQLLNIVNKILDISLLETKSLSVNKNIVNINELLDELYPTFMPMMKENISFSVEKGLSDLQSTISTDRIKVSQILNNLLNNALKYTDKGHIKFGYKLVNNELEFFVEDTGIGIEEEFHQKVFELFRKVDTENTRLYDGIGLGLAICKGNIELLEGRIWIESETGRGSTFFFTLPYNPVNDIEPERSKSPVNKRELNVLTLLVAEDDESNFLYIKEIFKGTGAGILHAVNGMEAVEMCKNNNNIDIVLIDIKMPVMNGYEAIKQIRKLRPGLPIIAQTAFALSNEMLKAFNAGSNDYISKPFSKEQLLTIIARYQ